MSLIFNNETIVNYINLQKNKRIVFTNGCFDLLHPGHLTYLEEARSLGDVLIVGLNSDLSVRKLKGKHRPINNQEFRARMLLGLKPVSAVVIFDEDTPMKLISIVKPHVHVKGGDYKPKDLPEYDIILKYGGEIKCLSFLKGYSTTAIINKVSNSPIE